MKRALHYLVRPAFAALILAFSSNCAQVEIDHVALGFPSEAFAQEPLSIIEGPALPPGIFSNDLADRLRRMQPSIDAHPGLADGPYQMMIELIDDRVLHDIDHGTDCDRDDVVKAYVTTSISDRQMVLGFRIVEKTTGHTVWSARGEYSLSRERSNSNSDRYPPAPPFPLAPPPGEIVGGINKVVASKLKKSLLARFSGKLL